MYVNAGEARKREIEEDGQLNDQDIVLYGD